MAINKAQGQRINKLGVYLPQTVFPMANCMLHFQEQIFITKQR